MNNLIIPNFLTNLDISFGFVPTKLVEVSAMGVLWQAGSDGFLLNVPNVARYMIKDGSSITIDPAPNAEERTINHFLWMTPLAALLHQRGKCVFHAAAVSDGHGAILIAGQSGAGKSTLLAALLQCGWIMLADDLAYVDVDKEGQALVYPMFSETGLWQDALDNLGIESALLPYCDANRKVLSWPELLAIAPLPLKKIYWLGVNNKKQCDLEKIDGINRFRAISMLQYNGYIADVLCDREKYLRCAAAIARNVLICNLRRPRGEWSVADLVDILEKNK